MFGVIKIIYFVLVLLLVATTDVAAQYSNGVTGMLNIPTAEYSEPGSVKLGMNVIPTSMVPNMSAGYDYTYNYFATVTIFSFLEFNYRATLLKSDFMSEEPKFNQQDRTYSVRALILKEREWMPALAVGANDPFADLGKNYYASYYGVLTKSMKLKSKDQLSASFGYDYRLEYEDGRERHWYDGFFGGVAYIPAFYEDLKFMVEYDTQSVNVGAAVLLWRHLSIHCYARDFNSFSAGLRYEGVLIH